MHMGRPPVARLKVLDAATRVLQHRSAAAFTLDAVAQEAGVSKGGLMYHFPTKEALLQALVARAVDHVDQALSRAAASDEPGAFTRAYLDITIPPAPAAGGPDAADGPPVGALAAAVSLDPDLLQPLREAYGRWQDRLVGDGLDPAAATAVRLAVDGWWLAALLHLPPLESPLHERTRLLLRALATAPSAGPGSPTGGLPAAHPGPTTGVGTAVGA
jgi:AcrR family transcriptional regulator